MGGPVCRLRAFTFDYDPKSMLTNGPNNTTYAQTRLFLLGSVCSTSITLYEGETGETRGMESCLLPTARERHKIPSFWLLLRQNPTQASRAEEPTGLCVPVNTKGSCIPTGSRTFCFHVGSAGYSLRAVFLCPCENWILLISHEPAALPPALTGSEMILLTITLLHNSKNG